MRDLRTGAHALAASLGDWRAERMPLAQSIAAAVREAVVDGRVPVGSGLPSERALAGSLGVSRGTVVASLSMLRDDGWILTRHGSGSRVRLPPQLTERTAPWSVDRGGGNAELDLTLAVTAAPHDAYLAALRRAVDRCATLLVDAGTPTAGLPHLRELLAARYTGEGLPTRPDQILITSGAQAALALLTDHLHDRRRPIAVENPTFPGALAILRRRRARLTAVPVGADGWDSGRLTQAVRAGREGLAYLMPDFHNPTGAVMPADLRADVAALAAKHELTIIADETMRDLDLRVPPQPLPHLAGANVITIGSTSKVIWSGLCVGWIRASTARIRELMLNPLQARLAPPPLEQVIALELLGDIAGILRNRRAQLRAQRDHLAALLAAPAAAGRWTYTVPPGGLAIWLRLRHTTAAALATRAMRQGLALSPGPQFSADRTLARYVRLPFTAPPDILTRAVDLLDGELPAVARV